jgi:hypothetical protein
MKRTAKVSTKRAGGYGTKKKLKASVKAPVKKAAKVRALEAETAVFFSQPNTTAALAGRPPLMDYSSSAMLRESQGSESSSVFKACGFFVVGIFLGYLLVMILSAILG